MSCESAQVAGGETSAVAAHPVRENRADRLDGTEAGRRVRQTTRSRLQHGLPILEPPRSGCTCARARRLVGDCEVSLNNSDCDRALPASQRGDVLVGKDVAPDGCSV